MDDKTEQDLTNALRLAAKSAMYKTAMIAPSYLIAAADIIDNLRAQLAEAQRDARGIFDAGWKAAASFCERDDVLADGIVGEYGCPQFERACADAIDAATGAPS